MPDAGARPLLEKEKWQTFLRSQRQTCAATQEARGLAPIWVDQIESFLCAHWDDVLRTKDAEATSLLHTELMREHVFVEEVSGEFFLSGIVDFEPSRVGASAYELPSVGLFFSEGDDAVFGAYLDGLGTASAQRGMSLARRTMGWALLHQYANLRAWMTRLPALAGARSLDDVARAVFSDGSA